MARAIGGGDASLRPRVPVMLDAFLARLPPRLRSMAHAEPELARALAEVVTGARERWPSLRLDPDGFASYLAERVPEDTDDVATGVRQLHAADLALAYACADGQRAGLDAFVESYTDDLDAILARILRSKQRHDEVAQLVRERLFVGTPEAPPAIVQYSGRSALRTWASVVFTRTILNLATRTPRDVPVEDEIFAALPAAGADPELEYFKRLYEAQFRAALREALLTLTAEGRNLLRYVFVDGLSIDEIGALRGVHRATAARWIGKARQDLHAGVRRELMARLRVDSGELDSIVRLIRSRIDVSVQRLLGADA
jgi:RNA polymerase sigma-70 factor (ECF subfamily)